MKSNELSDTANGKQHGHSLRIFRVVTIYEDFVDGIRAAEKFDSIVRALSGDLPTQAMSWSFSLLARPELNAIILYEVCCADVIVMATNGDRKLPERIVSWVAICTQAKAGTKPVLVALHDDGLEGDGVPLPLCTSLNGVADRVNARFMCNRDIESIQPESRVERHQNGSLGSNLESERHAMSDS